MQVEFSLDRRNIIGGIDSNTPLCVIAEIAQTLSLHINYEKFRSLKLDIYNIEDIKYLNKVVNDIAKVEYLTISLDNITREDLNGIAGFINGDAKISWTRPTLMNSLKHILKFYGNSIEMPTNNFVISQITPNNIYVYNACMLYKICKYHGINTTVNTSIEQLGQFVKLLLDDGKIIKHQLLSIVGSLSKTDLINLSVANEFHIISSPNIRHPDIKDLPLFVNNKEENILPDIVCTHIDKASINAAYQKLTTPSHYLPRIEPLTHNEAIVISAIRFGINLTECKNPFLEYKAIKDASMNGSVNNLYSPVDVEFKARYHVAPTWFLIKKVWAPKLSTIYSKDNLNTFLFTEGYDDPIDSAISLNEMLSDIRKTETFYLGLHPDCTKERTDIYFDPISELASDMIIIYGSITTKEFKVFSVDELTDMFNQYKNFGNPMDQTMFSHVSMKKLRNFVYEKLGIIHEESISGSIIGRHSKFTPPSTNIANSYLRLYDAIKDVDIYNNRYDTHAKGFRDLYNKKYKTSIQLLLQFLLEIGYYMRGWKIVSEDLPISSEQTNYPTDKQIEVELNTTQAINRFEIYLGEQPLELKTYFESLPLMSCKYQGKTTVFLASNRQEFGFTIIDRINIAKEGTSEYACIRMTSNWILISAYYYSGLCDLPIPFNLLELVDRGNIT